MLLEDDELQQFLPEFLDSLDPAWMRIQEFADLQEVMVRFIDGELTTTPWHGGPLDPESTPLVDALRAINTLGFVTENSQPGVGSPGLFGFVSLRQRAWVRGMIPSKRGREVIRAMEQLGYRVRYRDIGDATPEVLYRYPVTWGTLRLPSTFIATEVVCGAADFYVRSIPGLYQVVEDECMTVEIADPTIGRNELFDDLRVALEGL
jgi:hypothetical protein